MSNYKINTNIIDEIPSWGIYNNSYSFVVYKKRKEITKRWMKNYKLHRMNKFAKVFICGIHRQEVYINNGLWHNINGPAWIDYENNTIKSKVYYINDKEIEMPKNISKEKINFILKITSFI